jgi:RHS repeat-associated protein
LAYDGLGRRLSKTIGGTTTKFLYDGANLVQEQNSNNTATANLLTGLGVDEVFSRQVVGGATSSLLTDALGSTIALGDKKGAVQTSYTYEPFGGMTSSGATNTNSYQFTGRENDGASGLSFYRARYYSPTFGRFVSEDPLGFPGGPDPNLYAYVWNNPVGLVDSLGLDPSGGCVFLWSGCLASFFGNFFISLSATVSGWLSSAGDFLVSSVIAGVGGPIDVAAEILKRIVVGGILIGFGVLLVAVGVGAFVGALASQDPFAIAECFVYCGFLVVFGGALIVAGVVYIFTGRLYPE